MSNCLVHKKDSPKHSSSYLSFAPKLYILIFFLSNVVKLVKFQ